MPPSECVCVLFSGSSPRAIGHHTATNVELSLTTPLKGSASPVGDSWVFPLLSLKARPSVTFGTPSELSDYAAFVARAIRNSREALQRDHPNCESLSAALGRAEQEASLGRASSARDTAVGLIGYAQLAQLAEQLAIDSRTANNRAGGPTDSSQHKPKGSVRWNGVVGTLTSVCRWPRGPVGLVYGYTAVSERPGVVGVALLCEHLIMRPIPALCWFHLAHRHEIKQLRPA
jgi:hypothetical protein